MLAAAGDHFLFCFCFVFFLFFSLLCSGSEPLKPLLPCFLRISEKNTANRYGVLKIYLFYCYGSFVLAVGVMHCIDL